MQEQSTLEANKSLVRRWFEEVWNKGRAECPAEANPPVLLKSKARLLTHNAKLV